MSIQPPAISVIVPIYNVAHYLPQCLESICSQTFNDVEIILVDDGSTDGSGRIADSFAQIDNHISVIHKTNAGVSAARNDGLDTATGQYAYIMDSDDYLEPNALEIMHSKIEESGVDMLFSDHYLFNHYGDQRVSHFFPEEFVSFDNNLIDAVQCMVLHPGYSPFKTTENIGLGVAAPWTRLIKMDLIKNRNLRFDSSVEGVFDDGLFTLEILQAASSIAYIRTPTYHYRELGSSLIHQYNPRRKDVDEKIFAQIRDFAKRNNKDKAFYDAYQCRIVTNLARLVNTDSTNPTSGKSAKQRYNEYRALFKTEPYREAVANVDVERLKLHEQRIVRAARLHMLAPLWVVKDLRRKKRLAASRPAQS